MTRTIWTLFAVSMSLAALGQEVPEQKVAHIGDLPLESGETLREAKLGYRLAGKLNDARSNAVLFPTWFTGTSEALFASGAVSMVDTDAFFLIAVDSFGNGISSSPSNHEDFPTISLGDMVVAQHRLLTAELGLDGLHAVVGVSMGGMQTFEWITRYPDFVGRAVPVIGSPRLASYDILLWETQLEAIALARSSGDPEQAAGLVGMISELALRTPDFHSRRTPRDRASGLVATAKSSSSMAIEDREVQLRAMIAHDVTRRFDGSMERAAASVKARLLNVVGLEDHMVTPAPSIRFSALIGAESLELESNCGHLVFLCEREEVARKVRGFLK